MVAVAAPIIRKAAEFYTIALAQLADGDISILITATTVDETEPQLLKPEQIYKKK